MAKKLQIEGLSYRYALGGRNVLANVNLELEAGEKVLLTGSSGSGKSTLLRVISPVTMPRGEISGKVLLDGTDVKTLSRVECISKIAYVSQNPETQIVVDTVFGELAFSCENIGIAKKEARRRIAWTATYFGIEHLLKRRVSELSGGQKQIVSLAAAIMLKPEVLLLDEPTTYLDPVAAVRFLDLVDRINRDFGITVVVAEHRVSEFANRFDRVVKVENGSVSDVASDSAGGGADIFYERVFSLNDRKKSDSAPAVTVKNLMFRYDRNGQNVLDGVDIVIPKGSVFALLGGNGCGKTTFLRCLTGELKPQQGKIKIDGKLSAMTQNPLSMFIEETVRKDLRFFMKKKGASGKEADEKIGEIAKKLELTDAILDSHILDLSGGEVERSAIAKLILAGADVMLFDEPTKGLDLETKKKLAELMQALASDGITSVFVTHDINFALAAADCAGVLSSGAILE